MNFKNIEHLMGVISKVDPFQKKKLENYINNKELSFLEEFEIFIEYYTTYLNQNGLSIDYAIKAYLKMVADMFKSQIKFMRTGIYPIINSKEAFNSVYDNKKEMLSYMIGLALSQYLWDTHYEMYSHLKESLKNEKAQINNYLEIGPGHGLFLKDAVDILNSDVKISAIDISSTSLNISKSILDFFHKDKNITYINNDMLNLNLNEKYDFIVMGEVIEHVEQPQLLLNKISKILSKNGKAFLSTCVNCPAIDHVYHFQYIEEIRTLFEKCNLHIESEKVLPVENLSMDIIIDKKITINYSAIVKLKRVN